MRIIVFTTVTLLIFRSPIYSNDHFLKLEEVEKFQKISGYDQYVSRHKEMMYEQAKKRWGEKEFSADQFKKSSLQERAQMASFLLKNKNIMIGKSSEFLRQKLGRHDGFFWNDYFPTYLIEDDLIQGSNSWQLVFFVGDDSKIVDIKIYENR